MSESIINLIRDIIRYALYFAVFSLCASAFSFLLYHIYYGIMISFGMFLAPVTLNMIFYPTIGLFIFVTFHFLLERK